MRATLHPHPDFPAPSIAIHAEADRLVDSSWLSLCFQVTGDVAAIRVPAPVEPGRADELWRHTCFEAFVGPAVGEAYYEINVSPSGEWATYRFDSYRQGMARAVPQAITSRGFRLASNELVILAEVPFRGLQELAGNWRLGLTAVIEAADGALSYWSVAHPAGRPDFHHPDCLALELAAPEAP